MMNPAGLAFAVIVLFAGAYIASDTGNIQAPDGSDLPFPQTPSASIAGPTLATSKHEWRKDPPRFKHQPPNIVIFLTDDSGFSNADTFGGPVHTPTFSKLKERGITYNRFHNTAMCSPTRAALLTGRNHHVVGAGQIAEFSADWDGYFGEIPKSTATMAQVLSDYGYDTGAFGKWHNTPPLQVTPTGPFDQWPTGLGFRHFYGFIAGEDSQFEPKLWYNTHPVDPPKTVKEGYHLTEDLADHAILFMRNNRALTPDRPFFMYFAPGAVHGPHQVFSEYSDRYKGKFDKGWDVLRNETFENQKRMGFIPADAELTERDPTMASWDSIPEENKAFQTRLMEIFAGFLEHTDRQYGRVYDEIERLGQLNNTLIFYMGGDNGASAEGIDGTISELLTQNGVNLPLKEQLETLNRDYGGMSALGTEMLDSMYHSSWAWAGCTPFKSTKLVAAHFGGTRTPMVVSWPDHIKPDPLPRPQFHHVVDVVPTVYELLGIDPPKQVRGVAQDPMAGVSFAYTFDNPEAEGRKKTQYFEIMGSRGVYHDGWFAGSIGPRLPWAPQLANFKDWKPETDTWELYHIDEDYSQAHDLAKEMPDKLAEMIKIFDQEAENNKVWPVGGGLWTVVYSPGEIRHSTTTDFKLYPGQKRIPELAAPMYKSGVSSVATINASFPADARGVLYCVGGMAGGFTVYCDEGYVLAEYNMLGIYRYKVKSSKPLPGGTTVVQVNMQYDSTAPQGPATLALFFDGEAVGQTRVEKSVQGLFTAAETFDVGVDTGSPVSLDYMHKWEESGDRFEFTGHINQVHIKYVPSGSEATAQK